MAEFSFLIKLQAGNLKLLEAAIADALKKEVFLKNFGNFTGKHLR